jgi:hypothetical protein
VVFYIVIDLMKMLGSEEVVREIERMGKGKSYFDQICAFVVEVKNVEVLLFGECSAVMVSV